MSSISGLPEELLEVLGSLITQDMKPTCSLRRSSGQITVLGNGQPYFTPKPLHTKLCNVICHHLQNSKLNLQIGVNHVRRKNPLRTGNVTTWELRLIKWRASRHGKHSLMLPNQFPWKMAQSLYPPHLPLQLEISVWITPPFLWNMKTIVLHKCHQPCWLESHVQPLQTVQ